MLLDIRHLRLVEAIAQTGSVTAAARRLNLTQSALSHQLVHLEARLGSALFLRTGRRMRLTAAGQTVLTAAERALAILREAEQDVIARSELGPEGVLRITTECYTCYHWLPPVLARFRARHPRVNLQIVAQATRWPLRALADREVDVAIVSEHRHGKRFRYVPLFRDDFVAIVDPTHHLAEKPFLEARDFADEPLVLYDIPDERITLLSEILSPAGVKPGCITRVQLTEAVVQLVRAGFGLGTVARWSVAPELAAGTLVAIPLGPRGYSRDWAAAVHAGPVRSEHVDSFIDVLRGTSFSELTASKGPLRTLALVRDAVVANAGGPGHGR
ncbi:MAG TPA: LysR family transcriptional regulator [Gemmatimonadaceae bacterium]|nr:LysR family transcriptional regulator [Gemmatimonadaceae bacterium]